MKIEENILLSEFTTFKTGGPARFFVHAETVEDLNGAFLFVRSRHLSVFILGCGSNILVSEKGFDGLVIKVEIMGIEWKKDDGKTEVAVGAGEIWDKFVAECVKRGFYGVENLSGIPGTVGAAPVQNIGAYGTEVKDTIVWVEAFDRRTGVSRKLSNSDCHFGYRDSFFKTKEGKNFIITRVAFNLSKNSMVNINYKDLAAYFTGKISPTVMEVREAVLKIRASKFPDLKKYGTAGSFFKNPIIPKEKYNELFAKFPDLPSYMWGENKVKIPLAWILDNVCKIKGVQKGDVGFHKNQPLVIVNLGNAKAGDINALATEITKKVKDLTGIQIEREVETIG